MQIKLSNRLLAVSQMVIPGKPTADIGADHGYLAVYLIINGICPSVIATDRVRGPLSAASQLVDLLKLEQQIHIRLGDGLQALHENEVATICVAGMGGLTIKSILENSPDILATTQRLVLQPQSNISVLRRYLAESGWKIVDEDIAHDSGFYYEIMAAEKGEMQLSQDQAEFGPILLQKAHPMLRSYLEQKQEDLISLMAGLSTSVGEAVEARRKELGQAAQRIDHILASLPLTNE